MCLHLSISEPRVSCRAMQCAHAARAVRMQHVNVAERVLEELAYLLRCTRL